MQIKRKPSRHIERNQIVLLAHKGVHSKVLMFRFVFRGSAPATQDPSIPHFPSGSECVCNRIRSIPSSTNAFATVPAPLLCFPTTYESACEICPFPSFRDVEFHSNIPSSPSNYLFLFIYPLPETCMPFTLPTKAAFPAVLP